MSRKRAWRGTTSYGYEYLGMLKAAIVLALILSPTPAFGEDLTEEETLRGLGGVMPIVEELHEDAKNIGLSRETLEHDVAEKLGKAGITILSAEERMANVRRPYLYVNCNVVYVESIKLASFSIDVELHQRVRLADGDMAQGLTWAKTYLGIQGQAKAASKIREVVGGFIDEFIAASTKKDEKDPAGASGR